jgi:hypothetical protein
MSQNGANAINRLIGEFLELQERWEINPDTVDWAALQTLAQDGALAYNEGAGPSFHMLALDGVVHGEFHERFLAYSLGAGFDPFKLAKTGSGTTVIPVFSHSTLAEAARVNPSSARMHESLMELARTKFASLARETGDGATVPPDPDLARAVEACSESIPPDLLAKIAPELAKSHTRMSNGMVDPIEGRLTTAELIVDISVKPYG